MENSENNNSVEGSHSKDKFSPMELVKKLMTPAHLIGKLELQLLEAVGLRTGFEKLVYQVEDPLFNLWFSKSWDWKVYDDNLIPPQGEGPVVFACNHQSILDALTIGEAIYHNSKRMAFQLTKQEMGDDPLLGNYVSINHVIFIKRGEQDESAIEKCIKVLKEDNGSIMVYPEGTYGPGHGEFLPFKSGVIRIAFLGNAPIIPMACYGVDEIMGAEASRKMQLPKSKGVIHMKFGQPIPIMELLENNSNPTHEDFKIAASKLQTIIHSLWEDLAQQA
jgi:1-acyl-sn-glycerol-3-phosphate acyltransferase